MGHEPERPAAWASKLDGIEIVDGSEPFEHEYLYWVGCAGSFDDKNQKVTQAMAKLMQRAGVDFAILGPSENCTGDPARRSGNEYIFQMLAMQNVETLNGMGVKKIVTQCPHCFNTLMNEYPQLGGATRWCTTASSSSGSSPRDASTSAGRADRAGRATTPATSAATTTCTAPPQRHRAARWHRGGRGGSQRHQGHVLRCRRRPMWMEETTGTKVNDARSEELIATGASRRDRLPLLLHHDRRRGEGRGQEEDEVRVGDISMHVLEAIEAGERAEVERLLHAETVED